MLNACKSSGPPAIRIEKVKIYILTKALKCVPKIFGIWLKKQQQQKIIHEKWGQEYPTVFSVLPSYVNYNVVNNGEHNMKVIE